MTKTIAQTRTTTMLGETKVGYQEMAGGSRYPRLEISVLATTKICFSMSPAEAIALAKELEKIAAETQQYNYELEAELASNNQPEY